MFAIPELYEYLRWLGDLFSIKTRCFSTPPRSMHAAQSAATMSKAVPAWVVTLIVVEIDHALDDDGASLHEVQSTLLGHGNIATTSGYLHARPNTSSGLHLDLGVFLR
jgi:hypothetical protein